LTVIVGIDPGVNPTLCYLNGETIVFADDTSVTVKRGKAMRREPESHLIANILRRWAPDVVFIELVTGRPGESVSAVGSFMRGRGILEGACAGLGIPYSLVPPVVWTRALKLKKGDDAARQKALELCPAIAESLQRKGDHNRADAYLIALWGLKFSQHPLV
jgi:crossover junction endodeoxyribonuclease RuvC